MSSRKFDSDTQTLLEPLTVGNLKFKSSKTGVIFDANAEDTLLVNESVGTTDIIGKHKNTINTTAYDPANPRRRIEGGCPKCKRVVVSFQRLGNDKKMICVCLCGHSWA